MPKSNHREKYAANLLLALTAVTGSIFVIFYSIFEHGKDNDWYIWAAVAAILMCSGIYFSMQAFVHKVKSEFSRRQKQKEQHRDLTVDS